MTKDGTAKTKRKRSRKVKSLTPAQEKTLETLTIKQQLFVQAYLTNGYNGTLAARTAGYKGNENTLNSTATENLRKPAIKALIDKHRKESAESFGITRQQLIDELRSMAFSNIQDIVTEDNQLRNISDLDRDVAKTIESVQVTTHRQNSNDQDIQVVNTRVKQYSKLDAIKQLAVHLGFDDGDKGNVNFNIIINKF